MGAPAASTTAAGLQTRIPSLMLRDQRRLRRRLDGARRIRDADRRRDVLDEIAADVATAEERIARRRAALPAIAYPPQLPVTARRDDLLAAIRDHQVVIVAGETGSGKSTQLPKLCLELGRGVTGLIGHTQPRRLAARTLAERIADELGTPLGTTIGYQVRFTDHASDDTLVKLMTDGILLNEIQHDRTLSRYDTIIVDEAHERSLNIDFILGYLAQLLPRRPDLKVIVTSATIDPERFARHFGDAPVVEVSGRTYPVEVRYRPYVEDAGDLNDAIGAAVRELQAAGPGDVLVFLSGEREIRDAADALGKLRLRDTEVLPLYARLAAADQHKVFESHAGRRVVLATNVAETSLTVPGIRYVVDPGYARISRYSARTKVQRLPIEAISQASADQRKGRCGRVADGICVRLYAEDDFTARPEFTDPEILRTNLASVILQMLALGLGDVAAFPFLDPPDRRSIEDGLQLLDELGALEPGKRGERRRLTAVGRKLAQLPIDPRLGRMVLAGGETGCLREVVTIAAALSIQDPRERPAEREQAADEKHRRFADPASDFSAYLHLWSYLYEQRNALSSNQFRRMCRDEFLHYLRVREWQDVYGQLRRLAQPLGLEWNDAPAASETVHKALLTGLLSHLGVKDGERNEFAGARGTRFGVFPGSALFKKPPQWVMAAELVETTRLWARVVARIEPEWAEELAPHLVRRTYSEPHWSKKRAAVMAYEKVTLYGVPIVAQRAVQYGRIDPELSRELFVRHALVEGDWDTHHRFFHANRELLDEATELEERVRRRDLVVDDETLFAFYDERIPADVVSGRHFDAWWKQTRRTQPDLLTFDPAMLVTDRAASVREADYPDVWTSGDVTLPLSYAFEPGERHDGVTVDVPLTALPTVTGADLGWQVPGLREELVTALLRSLPKPLRRHLVPAPDVARQVLDRIDPADGSLLDAVARDLRRTYDVDVPRDAWDWSKVPDHLKVNVRVLDAAGKPLAEGRDLDALQAKLKPQTDALMSAAASGLETTGLRGWTLGPLPRTVDLERGGVVVTAYPALVDECRTAGVKVFATPAEQAAAMHAGTRRLVLLGSPSPIAYVEGRLSVRQKLALSRNPHASLGALLDDCVACAADELVRRAGGPAWDADAFARLRDAVRADLADVTLETVTVVERVLSLAWAVETALERGPAALREAYDDVRAQVAALVYPGFVAATGFARLPDLVRYLRAADRRLDQIAEDPVRDGDRMRRVRALEAEYRDLRERLAGAHAAELAEVRWQLEELRVSFFAQRLGTPRPVSEKRVGAALDALLDRA